MQTLTEKLPKYPKKDTKKFKKKKIILKMWRGVPYRCQKQPTNIYK